MESCVTHKRAQMGALAIPVTHTLLERRSDFNFGVVVGVLPKVTDSIRCNEKKKKKKPPAVDPASPLPDALTRNMAYHVNHAWHHPLATGVNFKLAATAKAGLDCNHAPIGHANLVAKYESTRRNNRCFSGVSNKHH